MAGIRNHLSDCCGNIQIWTSVGDRKPLITKMGTYIIIKSVPLRIYWSYAWYREASRKRHGKGNYPIIGHTPALQ